MSGGLGYSQNESSQRSESQAGLRGNYAEQLSPTAYNLATDTSDLARQYARNPFGYFQGYTANQLIGTDNPTGLPGEFGQYLNQAANQMFSRASAGGAVRGQVTPENTAGVVGSAITNLGASVLPYVTDLAKYKATLPESLMGSRLGYLQNTLGAMAPLFGSESTAKGDASGFGFSVSGGAASAPSMSTNCWIAGVLYGEGSPEQLAIRAWLGKQTGIFWGIVNRLYTQFGQRVARFIQPRPRAQKLFRPFFNYMLRCAHA